MFSARAKDDVKNQGNRKAFCWQKNSYIHNAKAVDESRRDIIYLFIFAARVEPYAFW